MFFASTETNKIYNNNSMTIEPKTNKNTKQSVDF